MTDHIQIWSVKDDGPVRGSTVIPYRGLSVSISTISNEIAIFADEKSVEQPLGANYYLATADGLKEAFQDIDQHLDGE